MPDVGTRRGATDLAPATGTSPLDEAYARGYAEGARAGASEAEERTRSAREALEGAARALRAAQAAFASEMEVNLTILGLAVARQFVQREVAADSTVVQDLVRRAVETTALDAPLEVRLNPSDLAALGPHPELYGQAGRRLEVVWVSDPSIERGGYVIETPHRFVDGRLDDVLQGFYDRLRNG